MLYIKLAANKRERERERQETGSWPEANGLPRQRTSIRHRRGCVVNTSRINIGPFGVLDSNTAE